MKRMTRMILRLYAPAAVLVVVGWGLSFAAERARGLLGAQGAMHAGSLFALLGTVSGFVWAMLASWRLYRWMRNVEQGRCHCGGLLSRPHRKHHQTAYRKCLACGEKTPLVPGAAAERNTAADPL